MVFEASSGAALPGRSGRSLGMGFELQGLGVDGHSQMPCMADDVERWSLCVHFGFGRQSPTATGLVGRGRLHTRRCVLNPCSAHNQKCVKTCLLVHCHVTGDQWREPHSRQDRHCTRTHPKGKLPGMLALNCLGRVCSLHTGEHTPSPVLKFSSSWVFSSFVAKYEHHSDVLLTAGSHQARTVWPGQHSR